MSRIGIVFLERSSNLGRFLGNDSTFIRCSFAVSYRLDEILEPFDGQFGYDFVDIQVSKVHFVIRISRGSCQTKVRVSGSCWAVRASFVSVACYSVYTVT